MERQALPLDEEQLAPFAKRAQDLLRQVKWTPNRPTTVGAKPTALVTTAYGGASKEDTVSVLEITRQLSAALVLIPDETNKTLNAIARGLQVGLALSGLYMKASGLESLMQRNRSGHGLAEPERIEFNEKMRTSAAILVYGAAAYIVTALEEYEHERHSRLSIQVTPPPEVSIENPTSALSCLLYYLGVQLRDGGFVRDPIDIVKVTIEHMKAVLGEIELRVGGLSYTEVFTSRAYTLGSFTLTGFSFEQPGAASSVAFNRVELTQIVGNRRGKHAVRRLAKYLVCYNPQTKRNIMNELKVLCRTFLGYSKPGTGKSLMIAALSTLISDYCQALGLPYVFHPLPADLIDKFQGGSADRMVRWIRGLHDPTRIVFGAIDDAEGFFRNRTHQGVSEGVVGVIQAYLTGFESATAVWHGQATVGMMTNIPEIIDPAVMSRITERFPIDGPDRWEDYLDQQYMWLRDFTKLDPSLVTMTGPDGYERFSLQAALATLSDLAEPVTTPRVPGVKVIFDAVSRDHSPTEEAFFAKLYDGTAKAYPGFSARDVRNISEAVTRRVYDIDLPDEWVTHPDPFHRQPHERQLEMVKELVRGNLRGLQLHEVLLQEAVRYLDNMVTMADLGFRRQVDTQVEHMRVLHAAQEKMRAA